MEFKENVVKAERLGKQKRKREFVILQLEKMLNSDGNASQELKKIFYNNLLKTEPSLTNETFEETCKELYKNLKDKNNQEMIMDEKVNTFLLSIFAQQLLEDDFKNMFFIMKITTNNEKDELLENIFNYCCSIDSGKHMTRILEKCVIQEVENTVHYGTCFRSNSTASKLSKIYSNHFTNTFITKTLQGIFTKVIEDPTNFEVDPLKAEQRKESFQKNAENVEKIVREWLDEFLSTPENIPYELRVYSKYIYENVAKKFPQTEEDLILKPCHIQIGGFIFLRILCPVFLTPEKIGITYQKQITLDTRRFFIIITKIIQNLANGIIVNEKEVYMDIFLEMTKSYMEKIKDFYEKIVQIDPKEVKIILSNVDSFQSLEKVHKFFINHLKDIPNEKDYDFIKNLIISLDNSEPFIEEIKNEIPITKLDILKQSSDSPIGKSEQFGVKIVPKIEVTRNNEKSDKSPLPIDRTENKSPEQKIKNEKLIDTKPNPNEKTTIFYEETKSGYLQKYMNGTWKWLYCIIQGAYLLIYNDPKSTKELENILLKGLEVENLNQDISKKVSGKEFSIRLTRPKEKPIIFGTQNFKDFLDWGIHLKDAGARYSKNIFLVDKNKKGPNVFSNIQDAILKSDAYDVIQVSAGTYNESLVINRPIHIIASEQAFIKGTSNALFTVISRGCCKISGFNVIEKEFEHPLLVLKGGTLIMSKMKLTGSKDCGIRVLNNGQLILKKCSIYGNGCGVLLRNESFGYLEMSDISRNQGTGLEVTMDSISMVKLSKFVSNDEHGIKITSSEPSWIEKSIFQENSKTGICVFPHNLHENKNLIVDLKDNVFIRNKEKNLQLYQKYDENLFKTNQME